MLTEDYDTCLQNLISTVPFYCSINDMATCRCSATYAHAQLYIYTRMRNHITLSHDNNNYN